MSKNFDDNYDEIISLKKNDLLVDDILIENLSKKYIMSDKSLEEKKTFLKFTLDFFFG